MAVPGHPWKIPIQDVVAAQHLRCLVSDSVTNPAPPPPHTLVPVVMDIYTGWILVGIGAPPDVGDVQRIEFLSFIPLGTKTGAQFDVQGYPEGAAAIVSASLSSFETSDEETTCAVDSATVNVVTQNFPGFSAPVLVLHAHIASLQSMINRVSYQVTVLANTQIAGTEFPTFVVSLDRDTTPAHA
jgi:hypothetical protein